MRGKKDLLLLFCIISFGALFRLYNTNWDQGYHLHPDERAIIMYILPLHLPSSLEAFFTPQSSLNPHFFAYGNFPLYLLKIIGTLALRIDPQYTGYDGLTLLGRTLSAIFDIGTIFVLYKIGKSFFSSFIGLLAAFFYTISVFPIQTAHFYAVDTMLTFFVTWTLYRLLLFYRQPSLFKALLVGLSFGLCLVTKISAIPLLAAITVTLFLDFLLIIVKQPHKPHIWFPHFPAFLRRLIKEGGVILVTTCVTFTLLQPYAIIDFGNFWVQNLIQSQMTQDAFVFPYTLQYVGITPYFYELKNVFLWGQGPLLATITFLGTFYCFFLLSKIHRLPEKASVSILLTFFLVYFAVVGSFAVGWMRYMLPLYPFLCLFGAIFSAAMLLRIQYSFNKRLFSFSFFLFLLLIWPLSFLSIYTKPHTRVAASAWITQTIPPGKTLAVEHWDDTLPLFKQHDYRIETLELYNPDSEQKWRVIDAQLSKADYLILASNRLYTPLQKLTKCQNLPPLKCYPKTAQYYQDLFAEKRGFKKTAEFTSYPTIPFTSFTMNDDFADESFTVYDHPKVTIFKKQ